MNKIIHWQQSGKILVQGLVDNQVLKYVQRMQASGVQIAAGVNPGSGGTQLDNIPVFDLVSEAISSIGNIQTSLVFVPPYEVLDASLEAIASSIPQIVIFSPHVPPLDTLRLLHKATETQTIVLGPGSGGILIPDQYHLTTVESQFYPPGNVALLHDSPTLSYEVASSLQEIGLGISIFISLGIDNILCSDIQSWLEYLKYQKSTEVVILTLQSGRITQSLIDYIVNYSEKIIIIYAYNQDNKYNTHLENALKIISRRMFEINSTEKLETKTVEDILHSSNLLLVNYPSQIQELLTSKNLTTS